MAVDVRQANVQQEILLKIDTNTVKINLNVTFTKEMPISHWLPLTTEQKMQTPELTNPDEKCDKYYWPTRTTKLEVPVSQL